MGDGQVVVGGSVSFASEDGFTELSAYGRIC